MAGKNIDEVAVVKYALCHSVLVMLLNFIFQYIKEINYLIIHLLNRE